MGGLTNQRLLIGAAAAALALIGIYYFSQPAAVSNSANSNAAVSGVNGLLAPGPLPEIVEGKADAKVTIVEYASMSCPHCAQFHNKVYPELKTKYIDTGKVRFIFREFPLNNIAVAASMLTRCVSEDKTKDLVSELFKKQNEWLINGDAVAKLFEVVKQAGFTKASFEKCLDDKPLYEKLVAVRTRGDKQFGVRSTPSFIINGKMYRGGVTFAAMSKAIDVLLK